MFRKLAIILGSVVLLAATAAAQSAVDGNWKVVSLKVENRTLDLPAKEVTLNIAEDRIGGNGGCNAYGGSFELKEKVVTFKEIFSTKMFCDDSSAFESMYFDALTKVTGFEQKKGRLVFFDAKRRTEIELEPRGN